MTETKRQSRPAKVAAEITEAGWEVETRKDGARRKIRATHPDGRVIRLHFERQATGRDVLALGQLGTGPVDSEREWEDVSVAQALVAAHRGPDVPFELDWPDNDVLAAVAGRTIAWRNSIAGTVESATCPRGGVHLRIANRISDDAGARVLTFASADGTGFRSVRLSAIEKVS